MAWMFSIVEERYWEDFSFELTKRVASLDIDLYMYIMLALQNINGLD